MTEEKYKILLTRIDGVRKKRKIVELISGLIVFATISMILLFAALALESLFHFKSISRLFLDIFLLIFFIVLFFNFVFRRLYALVFRPEFPDDDKIAKFLGENFPQLGDRLVNAIQVYRNLASEKYGASRQLASHSLNEIYEEAKSLDFLKTISWKHTIQHTRNFFIASISLLVFLLLFGPSFKNAAVRLLHPRTIYNFGPEISFKVSPGNANVIKNEPVTITAEVIGEFPDEIQLHIKDKLGAFSQQYTLTADQNGKFSYTIAHIQDTALYHFSYLNRNSEIFRLNVLELPMVRQLFITVTPPSYSKMNSISLEENVGDFSCLKGSLAHFKIIANKPLQTASIVFNNKKRIPLQINELRAEASFRIKEPGEYHIKLKDREGMENKHPIEYRISIIEDIYPTITIKFPGQDFDLSEDLILPLEIEAEDDFGFTRLNLAYRIFRSDVPYQDTTLKILPLSYELVQDTKLISKKLWELSDFDLFPGDVVSYYAQVFDNDIISGPKSTRSQTYAARFPTLEEMYATVNSEQEQTYEDIDGLYEQSKELKEEVDHLLQELKKNPELKWEEKQQIDEVLQNQKELEKSLEEIQQQLDQMLERMEKNDLMSLETLKKYAELQELLNEILTDELKEALKKLQQAAEQMDPELIKQAMEQLNFSQEDFLNNIEKSLELLKRIQIEQKVDELIRKLEQLVDSQQQISDKMENNLNQDEAESLAQTQDEVREKSDEVLKATEQLAESMQEFADMPDEAMEALLDQAKREGLLSHMNAVSNQLRQGNQNQAQMHSQKAMNALANALSNMNSARQQMIAQQKAEIKRELNRLTHNFLSMSQQQEQLSQKTSKLSPNSPKMNELADKQQSLLNAAKRNADKMAGLSKKTFFVTPQMARAVGQAMQYMTQALSQFEQRNLSQAARSQQRAMLSLNEAAKQMINAMSELENAQSASGLQEMLDKLAQMAGKQQGINQQTMQLGIGQQPLSLDMQAQMARLAAEQMALRKTLQQLQQEFGERSEILGRLDGIGKQMEEVAKDLQAKNVSRKTIQRQQKILQRLLDAQKSARRQDFSRKRRAETGKFYPTVDPGRMPEDRGEKLQNIQKDLLNALKEGYSRDYQELIKKYFEALIKNTAGNEN